MKKKLTAILAAFMLAATFSGCSADKNPAKSVIPITLVNEEFDIRNGVLIRYKGNGGELTIPDGVTSIAQGAFLNCDSLTSVTIPDGVTSIGKEAFSFCTNLTQVKIPDSVTHIGDDAFSVCKELTDVNIPDSVISVNKSSFLYTPWYDTMYNENFVIVGDGVLMDYHGNSTDIVIPENVKHISGELFSESKTITSVTIPDSVLSIGKNAFYNCINLTDVTIGKNVEEICHSAFQGTPWHNNLTDEFAIVGNGVLLKYNGTGGDVVIPDTVRYISDAFYTEYGSLYLEKEKNININSVKIPDSVTTIGEYAFYNCTTVTSIDIPDTVTTILDKAFYDCEKLSDITIPDSVTYIGKSAFVRCKSLTDITIPADVDGINEMSFGLCTELTSVAIPEGAVYIEEFAFSDCYKLTDITIPDSVTYINESALSDCDSLTNATYKGKTYSYDNIDELYKAVNG